MRYLSFLSLMLLCISCGGKEVVPTEPIAPHESPPLVEPSEKDKEQEPKISWADLRIPSEFKLVGQRGKDYFLRSDMQYHSWWRTQGIDLRIGSRIKGDNLYSHYLPKDDALPLHFRYIIAGGFNNKAYNNININDEHEVKELYKRCKAEFDPELNHTFVGFQGWYKDARQLHTSYWGIYPDMEKLVYGKSYHELDSIERGKGGIIYNTELHVCHLEQETEKPPMLPQDSSIVLSTALGYHITLILHSAQDYARRALQIYTRSGQRSDAERVMGVCESILFINLPKGEVKRGLEALESYRKFHLGEERELMPIRFGFFDSKYQLIRPTLKYSLEP